MDMSNGTKVLHLSETQNACQTHMPMSRPIILWIQIQKIVFHKNFTLTFRVSGPTIKRLSKYEFYDLTLHIWRKEPN